LKIDTEQLWYTKNILSILLLPLSWLFRLVSCVRLIFLKSLNLDVGLSDVQIIVVGNITVGGAGKTPFVSWLAQRCKDKNLKVGIISRGYGRKNEAEFIEVSINSDVDEVGDEALMLKLQALCPVAISADRSEAARYLIGAYDLDVIISDDGLQHYALPREYEIVIVDGEREFGNGWFLPAGPLRESISRLKKSDMVVSNGDNSAYELQYITHFKDAVSLMDSSRKKSIEKFKDSKLHAVAGIGNPKRFFSMLEKAGLKVIPHAFADHHAFIKSDLEFDDDLSIIMTEKDAVKCKHFDFAKQNIWYLPISVVANDKLEKRIEILLEDIS
jgi:tetraacyldisaccharide 4'-kinase